MRILTGYNHGASHGIGSAAQGRKVHVHRIHDALEVEWHFYIENLVIIGISSKPWVKPNAEELTLAPTSNDNAVPTRSFVPQSSYGHLISISDTAYASPIGSIPLAKGIWPFPS